MNICQSCGACCAHFRVSFYWAEANDGGGPVPAALTENISPHLRCMKGTWSNHPRCIALAGTIGEQVHCTIYRQRSSTCQQLAAGSEGCLRARQRWGLPAIADEEQPYPDFNNPQAA